MLREYLILGNLGEPTTTMVEAMKEALSAVYRVIMP